MLSLCTSIISDKPEYRSVWGERWRYESTTSSSTAPSLRLCPHPPPPSTAPWPSEPVHQPGSATAWPYHLPSRTAPLGAGNTAYRQSPPPPPPSTSPRRTSGLYLPTPEPRQVPDSHLLLAAEKSHLFPDTPSVRSARHRFCSSPSFLTPRSASQVLEILKPFNREVDLAELDGPFVKLRLKGRFWHKRSTVLARLGTYLQNRIPEILEVDIEDEKQLDDSPENF
ncbi:hypothetical protein Taro_040432 [Colocasia esculenta]|uniref:Uncharacterized protein n=1 Tax=Colocasia esculenta TaxID=4460 RepID=A0A843WBW0_COLES|nr:hypothetical protein [Colocasia esculenta]